jgi:hypothetical protein
MLLAALFTFVSGYPGLNPARYLGLSLFVNRLGGHGKHPAVIIAACLLAIFVKGE